jgi:hypothetical protein
MERKMIQREFTGGEVLLLDEADAWVMEKYSLAVDRKGTNTYIRTTPKGRGAAKQKRGYLHRVLMNCPANMQVDHIDGNGLNNTRSNLRLASPSQNMHNKGPGNHNTSGHKGVYWSKDRKRWFAKIVVLGREFKRGYFHNAQDAAVAYASLAAKHVPEFCKIDTPVMGLFEET